MFDAKILSQYFRKPDSDVFFYKELFNSNSPKLEASLPNPLPPSSFLSRVESVPDNTSKSPLKKVKSPGSKSHSKFTLFASEKTFEFQVGVKEKWIGIGWHYFATFKRKRK